MAETLNAGGGGDTTGLREIVIVERERPLDESGLFLKEMPFPECADWGFVDRIQRPDGTVVEKLTGTRPL